MNKIITMTIMLGAVAFLYIAIVFDIIPPIFWSAKEFSNPSYHKILEKEWVTKPSNFLLKKLYSIDPMRFGLAAHILGQRREQRAISILSQKVRSSYIDDQIHFSACSALAQISPSTAKNVLFEIVRKHQNGKSPKFNRYKNALRILASMKDERIYPICLQMAKSDNRQEREFTLDGVLYYFDNHGGELLPLYIAYLNSKESYKGQVIREIKNLKRPEAIPALEKFASSNKAYEKDARDAILYLKGLQK